MTEPIITVENLSKQYRIGARELKGRTFREAVVDTLAAPVKNLRRLRQLTRFDDRVSNSGEDGATAAGTSTGDTIWALKDVSFMVQPGEVVGIIGRNGAGKSTLLKILSRITEPTSGEVKLYGRVSSLLEVGTGFHPELTGRENIYLNGTILGMRKAEIDRKFDEIVAFSEIEKFLDTPVKRYSSGMYVRLAFAVAAHLEPEILLVDEVLAVGDIAFQQKCMGKMKGVASSGRTVLFISHNMAAIRKLCRYSILLNEGRALVKGTTEEVINTYLSSGSSENGTLIHLPQADPEGQGSGLNLSFLSTEHQPKSVYKIGEKWIIRLEFLISRKTDHAIAAVGLVSTEGISITTFWSKPRDLLPGRYSVEFLCDLPLKAMTLQFVVGLSSYERTFYYADRLGSVAISAISKGKQPLRASTSGILMNYQESDIRLLSDDRSSSLDRE